VQNVIVNARVAYQENATSFDDQDGISLDFIDHKNPSASWRFNVRGSNTEPLIRLNVEAKSQAKMEEMRDALVKLIEK
jgi:phosphomannomutase